MASALLRALFGGAAALGAGAPLVHRRRRNALRGFGAAAAALRGLLDVLVHPLVFGALHSTWWHVCGPPDREAEQEPCSSRRLGFAMVAACYDRARAH